MGVLTRVTLHTPDERLTGFGCLTASIPEQTPEGRPRTPQVVTQLVVHS